MHESMRAPGPGGESAFYPAMERKPLKNGGLSGHLASHALANRGERALVQTPLSEFHRTVEENADFEIGVTMRNGRAGASAAGFPKNAQAPMTIAA